MNERPELEISALLDGELDHTELLSIIDRLVDDAELQHFYRRNRRLAAALEEGGVAAAAGALPAGLWERIEDRARGTETGRVIEAGQRFARLRRWGLAAAAVVVLAVGVLGGLRLAAPPSASVAADDVLTVHLGSQPQVMDDERFVELTAELLRAEPKYRRMMDQIVSAVNEQGAGGEGSPDEITPIEDRDVMLYRAAAAGEQSASSVSREWY